jgi:hypothetical protein
MNGFFDELHRRKVYRVAAAYIIVATGVIQLAFAAFPAWDLPNWTLRLVIVVLLLGFPIALMLAWAYDIAEGKRAVELLPESEDAFDGPQATTTLAQIYAWTGESDAALRLLDHLLVVPSGLTVPVLKLHLDWDPLRKDPRFQALIDKHAGNH